MDIPRISYTREQIIHLQSSPLVKKPDGLPSIEQWMDQQQKARPPSGRENEPSQLQDVTQRPSILATRHFSRGSSTAPEDIVLGPPKMAFASASRTNKLLDTEKRISGSHEDDSLNDRTNLRERFFKERDGERNGDRTRERATFANGRRSGREEGEGWTNVKNRKSLEEGDRFLRNGDRENRDRDRTSRDGDGDALESTPRRMGFGRGRDPPWGRDENGTREAEGGRLSGRTATSGGWRDREREREQGRDRDRDRRDDRAWNRGSALAEEVPEWMDTPAEEKKTGHTMEDFQKWKEQMNARNKGVTTKEEETLAEEAPKKVAVQPSANSKPATPLAIEPDKMFSMWGEAKRTEANVVAEAPAAAKTVAARNKASKFAAFFSPAEEKKAEEAAPQIMTPPPDTGTSNEDKEGFKRILEMLGSENVSSPSPGLEGRPPPSLADLFKPAPPQVEPPEQSKPRPGATRTREERNALLEAALAPRTTPLESRSQQSGYNLPPPPGQYGGPSPILDQGIGSGRSSRMDPGRDEMLEQPPSRNGIPSEISGLAALLESRSPHEQHQPGLSKDREFLLNLMQQSRGTPPQISNQGMPRPPPGSNVPMFSESRDPNGGIPKQMAPPPGLGGHNPQMMNDQQRMRQLEMQLQHQQQHHPQQQQHPEVFRKNSQAHGSMGGGFFDDPAIANISRRNTNEQMPNPARLQMASNLGIPSQPMPEPHWMKNPNMHNPHERVPPPPGFPGRMPQIPPGFGGGQMPFGVGNNGPMGPPGLGRGGIPGPGGPGGPGMFPGPGHAGQMPPPHMGAPPQGPPQQGYPFGGPGPNAPPGFGPPMGDMMGPNMNGPQRRGPPGFDMFPDMGRGRGGMPPGFGM